MAAVGWAFATRAQASQTRQAASSGAAASAPSASVRAFLASPAMRAVSIAAAEDGAAWVLAGCHGSAAVKAAVAISMRRARSAGTITVTSRVTRCFITTNTNAAASRATATHTQTMHSRT